MTDSQALINNNVAVSSACLYNLKPSSVRGRAMRTSVPPSNKSTFEPSDTAIFSIPCGRRNTFLDPSMTYVRMTVLNRDYGAADNSVYPDGTAACFINRVDTFHASNQIESIQQYNVLYNYLVDFQFSDSTKCGLSSVYGTGTATSRQGDPLKSNSTTTGLGERRTYCMPLLGLLGVGSEKYIPVGQLLDDIRLEITFESKDIARHLKEVTTADSLNAEWQIMNIELELGYVELSDEGMGMVNATTPFNQPIFLHTNTWRHYVSTIPATTTGNISYLVPARFASLRQLVMLPRRSTEISTSKSYSISSRINPNLEQVWLRIGSYLLPQRPITLVNSNNTGGYAEAYAEIMKSFHSLTAPQFSVGINQAYFNVRDAAEDTKTGVTQAQTGDTSYQNAFALAIDLETFAQRTDLLISGINTLSSPVYLEGIIGSTGPTAAYTLDIYGAADCIMMIDQGIMSAKM